MGLKRDEHDQKEKEHVEQPRGRGGAIKDE